MKKTITKKIYLCMVLLWGIGVGMFAQKTAIITMNFNSPDSKAVSMDSTYYSMVGDRVTFTVQVDPTEPISSIKTLSYTLNGQTVNLAATDYKLSANNIVTIDVSLSQEMVKAAFNIMMEFSTARSNSVTAQGRGSYLLTVLPAIVAPQYSASGKQYVTADKSSLSMGVQIPGEGGGTWIYSWDDGTSDLQKSFNPATSTIKTTTNLTLTITNVAPDNKTEWYKETITYPIYVYEKPIVQTHSIANDLTFYKQLPEGYWTANITGGGNTNEFLWYVNGVENKSQSNQFNPQTSAGSSVIKDVVKLVVVTYADDGTELWRSDELFNEEYTIYPQATLSADKLTKSIYLGESITFAPTYNGGGNPSGNEYEWSGDTTGSSKDLIITPNSTGTFTYILKSQNKYGNAVWEAYDDQIYTLNVYEQPSSVMTETITYDDQFDGGQNVPAKIITSTLTYPNTNTETSLSSVLNTDIVSLSVANSNGAESWSYTVTDNGELLAEPYQLPQTVGTHQIVISVVNGSSEMETPYRAEYKHSYIVYLTPSADRTNGYMTSYETCGGRQVPLSVYVDGGDANGWSCQWKKDGKDIGGQTAYSYTDDIVYNTSGDADMKSYVVGANVIYTLDGIVRLDKTVDFTINYWPMPQNIDNFTITDVQKGANVLNGAIRKGNTLRFSAERAVGGYGNPSVWQYQWTKNDVEFKTYTTTNDWTEAFEEEASVNMGKSKVYEDVVYALRTTNPQNGLWAENMMSKTVRIYNRPETPTSLVKKGSGASGTMIATTTGLTDANLEGYQYFLVFGYEDAFGNEIKSFERQQSNPGNTRFETQFSSSEVNNSSNRFFVYAMWKYDNGVKVTSGKRYVDSVDEEWDGSDYIGATRAIPDMASSIEKLFISSSENVTRVYTLGGQIIKNPTNLSQGVYIVETISDGKRIAKKMFVK